MDAGLNGKLATHSLRKSFAQRVYEESGDIYLVQELLGHKNVSTTQKYIGINYASAREAVEGMALAAEPYRSFLLSGSFRFLGAELKATTDETLFLELALPRVRPLKVYAITPQPQKSSRSDKRFK